MSAEPVEFSSELMDLCSRELDVRKAMDKFWGIWRDDYMRNLPPLRLKKSNSDLKIGSVVIINNESRSRLTWPLGIVTKLYTGKDGFVRAVQLKTVNGFIDRPIQLLHKLEVDGENEEFEVEVEDDSSSLGNDENVNKAHAEIEIENNKVLSRGGRVIKPRKILDL